MYPARLIRVSSHQLTWLTYHTYLLPDIFSESHLVEEVGRHIKFSLELLRPRKRQEAVVCIEKGCHLTDSPLEPIQSHFLPGYFHQPVAEDRSNYNIEYGGG